LLLLAEEFAVVGGGALKRSAADIEELDTIEELDGTLLWFPEATLKDCL